MTGGSLRKHHRRRFNAFSLRLSANLSAAISRIIINACLPLKLTTAVETLKFTLYFPVPRCNLKFIFLKMEKRCSRTYSRSIVQREQLK